MGLINKSKQSTNTVNNFTETNNIGASEGSIAANNSFVSIQTLDGGAINQSFGLADKSLGVVSDSVDFAERTFQRALGYASSSANDSARAAQESVARVSSTLANAYTMARQGDGERALKYSYYAGAVMLLIIFAVARGKK